MDLICISRLCDCCILVQCLLAVLGTFVMVLNEAIGISF